MIDEADKKIIGLLQGDLPAGPRPFAMLSQKIGMSEEEFIARVKDLRDRGVIRRFGATLRHQEAGYSSNAMVAWVVPEDRVEEVGKRLARRREVSHCYERRPQKDWKYNLYTMIHGSSREECRRIVEKMAESVGIEEYRILFSEREFKKTSMAYFEVED